MGIPSYFSYIIKNHQKIIQEKYQNKDTIHELYFDSNSIIYDCIRKSLKGTVEVEVEDSVIYKQICLQIQQYINDIQPTELVFISFDGIAPFAKLKQQRDRRFKGQYTKSILNTVLKKKSNRDWDTCAITPGTAFMKKLDDYVNKHFKQHNPPVIFTGSRHCGEGEHKIMQHIRNTKDTRKNAAIYGLDADLIMLALNHLSYRNNIYLYRETPEFIKSIRIAKSFKNVEILWASVREPYNYTQAKQLGCHIITIPPSIIEKIQKFGKSFDQLTQETVKAFLVDSKKSKFKI